jgi:hypothetical protein
MPAVRVRRRAMRLRTFFAPPPPPLALALPAPKPAARMLCTVRRPPGTTRTLDARNGAVRTVRERSAGAGTPPSAAGAPPAPPQSRHVSRSERLARARHEARGGGGPPPGSTVRHCTLARPPPRVHRSAETLSDALRCAGSQRHGEPCAGGHGRQSYERAVGCGDTPRGLTASRRSDVMMF